MSSKGLHQLLRHDSPRTVEGHQVRWFARWPGHSEDWTPRTRGMVGGGWSWDVKCSCGWESRTGGAVESYVKELVAQHKWDVENGFWKPEGQS